MVISWAEKPQVHLDLFTEPHRGLTRGLDGLGLVGGGIRSGPRLGLMAWDWWVVVGGMKSG
jgi:hypothetical protein